ncbi:unnamed protein product [Candidula unifasciata]|uniref:PTTG1IP n=1 Tax=Candidula unifasciata TaxID=100452 RepID=A0A8S3ZY87_9EUPU|nr:unnamed protein product [Candidula unifasciata]
MNIVLVTCILGTWLIPVWSSTIKTTFTSQTYSNSTQTSPDSPPASFSSTRSSPVSTTPTHNPTPGEECAKLNTSCDTCISNSKCLYCYSDSTCKLYPSGKILPSSDDCALDEARWGVCWLNFQAMIISVSVIGGVIVFTITFCCIYYCCCRKSGRKKQEQDDTKFESRKMERKVKQNERRSDRKSRMDDIRRKYGLMKDDTPYQQFES